MLYPITCGTICEWWWFIISFKDKDILFSEHANQRMKKRNIDRDSVEVAISSPDRITSGKEFTKVLHKQIGNVKFRVVIIENEDELIVVTIVKE